jgi:primosomal protein N' (replication factor Y) (superfamily II helicase)
MEGEQLALLREEVRRRRPKAPAGPAPEQPVARVAVDLPLAHLDREFDYLVPETLHQQAVPGCRVKVRFSGRDVDGFVVARADDTDHVGRLAPLRRVVSSEPVLHREVHALARQVADRYAGTLADVLRLAVPPRHARVEAEEPKPTETRLDVPLDTLAPRWASYPGGEAFLRRLGAGESPHAVWTALPGSEPHTAMAAAAAATAASGRGSLLLAPDAREVARLDQALTSLLGAGRHVVLSADLGPAARYRAFLAVSRGQVPIVVGTRAAAFAPVASLGLVALWDDGDDLYAEPRAPYPHAREVLLLRAHGETAAMMLAGHVRSVEGQALVESGWAAPLTAERTVVRAAAPQVHVTGESERERERDSVAATARMPRRVFEVVREALTRGPVLVHNPRFGYQPALACATCHAAARCPRCQGPLARPAAGAAPGCRWCGHVPDPWACPHCQGDKFRSPVVGSLRTAEEWGRSFASVPVATSGGDHVLDEVPDWPDGRGIVIATPGAEPVAEQGYAAAVLLDTWLSLSLPGLRATEEAVRRWFNIASLVRPGDEGGRVIAVGEPTVPALQALVRWDPESFAGRELAERTSAHLTPAARLATISGAAEAVTEALAALHLPRLAEVLGPVEVDETSARVVVRTTRDRGAGLSKALVELQAGRSTRKLPPVRVQVDPADLV